MNLAIGVLYAWSVLKSSIESKIIAGEWNWDLGSLNDPYAMGVLIMAAGMIPAGKMLDKWGSRFTASIGGLCVGVGFIWVSFSTSYLVWLIGFGILACFGIGLVYASATPAAVKWFPSNKTGVVTGIVVAGFGLASAYIAPLASVMNKNMGINETMLWLGVCFMAVIITFAQFLTPPPEGYVAPEPEKKADAKPSVVTATTDNYTWQDMMKTVTFWKLWAAFFIGSGAGLMVIGFASGMAKAALGEFAWLAIVLLAIGNASGRITAGVMYDKMGRKKSLYFFLTGQALLILSLTVVPASSGVLILLVATLIGFCYGSNLTLFPSSTKSFFGTKNFGMNYGMMYTAWGVGGAVLARVSQMLYKNSGSLDQSAYMAAGLLVIGLVINFFSQPPKDRLKSEIEPVRSAS